MDIFGLLTLFGGVALFLYGMTEMGKGLEKSSGGKLKSILEKLTSNRIKAVMLGAGVTAVIQSSSATTVMVVGFVNSGIMKLSQAIGIIMGANIGTTITSWILSLTGIQSDNFIINLFKPSTFAPILAVIGVIFLMFTKSEKKKDLGMIFLGFTILIYGMEAMSGAVAPLADVPEFRNILLMFSHPILGLIAGTVLTAVIQSSSASVGILQALALTGAVSYGVAIPIIMGQNIGTCITAILSAIGANKNAKRAAAVHLYFNLIGTTLFMIIFYSINVFVRFEFLDNAASVAGIAVIHTVFNIVATFVLLPFAGFLEKLAIATIKDDKTEIDNEFQTLDVRFLESPGYAIKLSRDMGNKMAEIAKDGFLKSVSLFKKYDQDIADEVITIEGRVDRYEDEIGSYLLKLSSMDLTKADNKVLSLLLHCLGEYERISDHAVNIAEAAKEISDKNIKFSEKAEAELDVLIRAVTDVLEKAIKAVINLDISIAKTVEPLEEVIDTLNNELKNRHIGRLREGTCTIELGFIFSDITTNLERISDHCSNLAVFVIQLSMDEYDIHEYLDILKHEDNQEFKNDYKLVKKQYKLPVNS